MGRWNLPEIREELNVQLDKIQALDDDAPLDHAGGRIPITLAILGLLEKIASGSFFGTLELPIKGTASLNPRVTSQTSSMTDTHTHLLR